MRFEVSVNGERVCVAGLEDKGAVRLTVSCSTCWPRNEQDLSVDGVIGDTLGDRRSAVWGKWALTFGDEVTVRLLPPGESDPPVSPPPEKDPIRALDDEVDGSTPASPALRAKADPLILKRRPRAKHQADIRFQVRVNGRQLCVAGVAGSFILHAELYYADAASWAVYSGKLAFLKVYSIEIEPDYLPNGRTMTWPHGEVTIGDEVSVKLLPAGESDAPLEVLEIRESASENNCEARLPALVRGTRFLSGKLLNWLGRRSGGNAARGDS